MITDVDENVNNASDECSYCNLFILTTYV